MPLRGVLTHIGMYVRMDTYVHTHTPHTTHTNAFTVLNPKEIRRSIYQNPEGDHNIEKTAYKGAAKCSSNQKKTDQEESLDIIS